MAPGSCQRQWGASALAFGLTLVLTWQNPRKLSHGTAPRSRALVPRSRVLGTTCRATGRRDVARGLAFGGISWAAGSRWGWAKDSKSSFPLDIGAFPTDLDAGGDTPPAAPSASGGFPLEIGGGEPAPAPAPSPRSGFPAEIGGDAPSSGFPAEIGGEVVAPPKESVKAPKQKFDFAPQEKSSKQPPAEEKKDKPAEQPRAEAGASGDVAPVERKKRKKSRKKKQVEKSAELEEKLLQASVEDLSKRSQTVTPYRYKVIGIYSDILNYNAKTAGFTSQSELDAIRGRLMERIDEFKRHYSNPNFLLKIISPVARDPSVKKFAELLDYVTDKMESTPPTRPLDLDMDEMAKIMNAWDDAVQFKEEKIAELARNSNILNGQNLFESINNNTIGDTGLGDFFRSIPGFDPEWPSKDPIRDGKVMTREEAAEYDKRARAERQAAKKAKEEAYEAKRKAAGAWF